MPTPAPAAPGGQPQPPQPPFGATPATGATPNKGYEAAGLQKLGVVVKQLEGLLPEVGAVSSMVAPAGLLMYLTKLFSNASICAAV